MPPREDRTTTEAFDLTSHSPEQTQSLGAHLGEQLQAGDVVLLQGELGAGKTAFVQGLARGLGVGDDDPVTSPTFTLVHEHPGRLMLYHVDLYRLSGVAEATGIGLEDYLASDGVTVIEWPDRASALLPSDHLTIHLRPVPHADSARTLHLAATGERSRRLLAALKESATDLAGPGTGSPDNGSTPAKAASDHAARGEAR